MEPLHSCWVLSQNGQDLTMTKFEMKFITYLKLSLHILRVNYDSCTSDSHDCIFQNFVMKFMYKKDTNITTCIIIFIIKKIVMLNLFREAGKKLFPKKIQTPKKYPNHPKIAFFDPKFTFRFPKAH